MAVCEALAADQTLGTTLRQGWADLLSDGVGARVAVARAEVYIAHVSSAASGSTNGAWPYNAASADETAAAATLPLDRSAVFNAGALSLVSRASHLAPTAAAAVSAARLRRLQASPSPSATTSGAHRGGNVSLEMAFGLAVRFDASALLQWAPPAAAGDDQLGTNYSATARAVLLDLNASLAVGASPSALASAFADATAALSTALRAALLAANAPNSLGGGLLVVAAQPPSLRLGAAAWALPSARTPPAPAVTPAFTPGELAGIVIGGIVGCLLCCAASCVGLLTLHRARRLARERRAAEELKTNGGRGRPPPAVRVRLCARLWCCCCSSSSSWRGGCDATIPRSMLCREGGLDCNPCSGCAAVSSPPPALTRAPSSSSPTPPSNARRTAMAAGGGATGRATVRQVVDVPQHPGLVDDGVVRQYRNPQLRQAALSPGGGGGGAPLTPRSAAMRGSGGGGGMTASPWGSSSRRYDGVVVGGGGAPAAASSSTHHHLHQLEAFRAYQSAVQASAAGAGGLGAAAGGSAAAAARRRHALLVAVPSGTAAVAGSAGGGLGGGAVSPSSRSYLPTSAHGVAVGSSGSSSGAGAADSMGHAPTPPALDQRAVEALLMSRAAAAAESPWGGFRAGAAPASQQHHVAVSSRAAAAAAGGGASGGSSGNPAAVAALSGVKAAAAAAAAAAATAGSATATAAGPPPSLGAPATPAAHSLRRQGSLSGFSVSSASGTGLA